MKVRTLCGQGITVLLVRRSVGKRQCELISWGWIKTDASDTRNRTGSFELLHTTTS